MCVINEPQEIHFHQITTLTPEQFVDQIKKVYDDAQANQ